MAPSPPSRKCLNTLECHASTLTLCPCPLLGAPKRHSPSTSSLLFYSEWWQSLRSIALPSSFPMCLESSRQHSSQDNPPGNGRATTSHTFRGAIHLESTVNDAPRLGQRALVWFPENPILISTSILTAKQFPLDLWDHPSQTAPRRGSIEMESVLKHRFRIAANWDSPIGSPT